MRLGALAVCAFTLSSCGPPPKPPLPAPVTVTGTLVEQVTGAPLASVPLRLSAYCYNCGFDLKPIEVTTGPDGAFRIEGVPLGSDGRANVSLHRLREPGADRSDSKNWESLSTLDPKQVYRGKSGEFQVSQGPPPSNPSPVDRDKPFFRITGAEVDAGKHLVFDPQAAARAYTPVCESGQPRGAAPPASFAVLKRSTEKGSAWSYDDTLHLKLAKAWKPPFPAILCIVAGYRVVGEYSSTVNAEREKAREVTWRVSLINARDGTVSKKEFSASPPLVTTQYKTFGDPTPDLEAWLKQSFPEAASGG